MSDYYRPTASFPSGAYNATQVRLYGLDGTRLLNPAATPVTKKNKAIGKYKDKKNKENSVEVNISIKDGGGNPVTISDEEIDILPIDIKTGLVGVFSFTFSGATIWPAIIYGYSYEGHCYDFPKPKIMFLPTAPEATVPDDDCGYDKKPGYQVWIVDKLDECVELDVNRGFMEQLVLDANMPGRRSPSSYRATMAVSHRSGRAME